MQPLRFPPDPRTIPARPGGGITDPVIWGKGIRVVGGNVVAKRPQHSRYRRLPGLYRFHERKPSDPGLEPQRLTLYVPGNLLDCAESLALRSGHETVQQYCEVLLGEALEAARDRERVGAIEARRGPLDGLKGITDDPEFLAELSVSATSKLSLSRAPAREPLQVTRPATEWEVLPEADPRPSDPGDAAAIVLRHAGDGVLDHSGFLATLRRGEPVGLATARELLQALTDLEIEHRDLPRLDRRLAYALHRLAFEGQVLLTDAWPASAAEGATVDVLRMVQEAVDRILSGEDIRYFSPGPEPEPTP